MKTAFFLGALLSAASAAHAIPNPSSVFCIDDARGQLFSGETADLCLVDGAGIEPWTLFWAAEGVRMQEAGFAFLVHRQVNLPASRSLPAAYCEALGGSVLSATMVAPQARTFAVCRFQDNSVIELWTLYRGPAVHTRLAALLKRALR